MACSKIIFDLLLGKAADTAFKIGVDLYKDVKKEKERWNNLTPAEKKAEMKANREYSEEMQREREMERERDREQPEGNSWQRYQGGFW